MKRYTIIFLVLLTVVFSCKNKNDNRQKIIGSWHAVKMENPDMDSFFSKSQLYIDTVGKGHDDSTNIRLYGVANMDSMRKILQVQYDSAKTMQMKAVTNTIFTFRKDSVAMLSFSGVLDSSKWGFDSTGKKLVLTEMNPAGPAATVSMDVLVLSDTELKVKMEENNTFSIVTFRLEGK